jgi:hypothetical protein
MAISTDISRLRLLHMLEVSLRAEGITTEVKEESVCLFKPCYDKPTAMTYGVRSAAASLQHGACFGRLYCVEQYDAGNQLVKFAVHVTNADKTPLHHWDLDFSNGFHTHGAERGDKSREHIPFGGGLPEVVRAIIGFVKGRQ